MAKIWKPACTTKYQSNLKFEPISDMLYIYFASLVQTLTRMTSSKNSHLSHLEFLNLSNFLLITNRQSNQFSGTWTHCVYIDSGHLAQQTEWIFTKGAAFEIARQNYVCVCARMNVCVQVCEGQLEP